MRLAGMDRPLLCSPFTMESPRRRPAFDLTALSHPAWWAALAVLLINDNLLKGRGVVPGWLTGKLSDLAFVVVAPTLFAALLPRALPARRALAFVSVVGLYVAADLSRAVSDGFVAVMARVGIAARLWPDVTDLLALAMLPLTIHLLRLSPRAEGRGRFTLQRIGVMTGAAACLATSAPLGYQHEPFLLNATTGARTIRVTWVLRQLPCDPPETIAAALDPSDLDDPRSFDLGSGQTATLGGLPAMGQSPVGMCPSDEQSRFHHSAGCVGAILESEGVAPVLMVAPSSWEEYDGGGFFSCQNPPSPVSRCRPQLPLAADPGPDAVSLRVVDGQPRFMVGPPPPLPNPRQGRFASPSAPPSDTKTDQRVRIAPIDPATVASRLPTRDGCRALREDYETLTTAATCASNLDCLGRKGLPIGGSAACDIDINIGAAAMIEEIGEKWSAACRTGEPVACAALPQPAVCRDGICAPVCPGVVVPTCAPACTLVKTPEDGESCGDTYFPPCRRPDGQTCTCGSSDMRVHCTAPPTSATCPLPCVDAPGGGTFP
jgi:hypothetical protein